MGKLQLVAHEKALVAVLWENDRPGRVKLLTPEPGENHPVLRMAIQQLTEYFAGERRTFELPLDPQGSAFQQEVWLGLREIPYGETLSYGALAAKLGKPKAARAVGLANGRNPLSIVVPCHRVIGASGKLTGFAGGLGAKETLLKLERERFSK